MRHATKFVPSPLMGRLRRLCRARLIRWAVAICILAGLATVSPVSASAATCGTSVMVVVAHQDDSLLFLSPDLLHDIQAGDCVTTVYLTAGDDGEASAYWQSREAGANAAYANMAGVANNWNQGVTSAAGHSIVTDTLQGAPITQVYLRLPDGNADGSGFAMYNYQSLDKLWTGAITTINPVDGSPGYTAQGLVNTLVSLMNTFQPTTIRTQDYTGYVGDDDHADHVVTAYFTRAASQRYTTPHQLIGYMGYDSQYHAQNVSGADLTAKTNAFNAYAQVTGVCNDPSCSGTSYPAWLGRQYITASENAPTPNQPPTANAGPSETVIAGVAASLNGSGSSDPNGDLLSYQWTQTAGPSVTLSSSTSPQPTFTAPDAAVTLTFQLVVNDGQVNSAPSTVTITVSDAGGADVALTATATASSQTSAQPASAAIDGIVSGYPYDSSKEWSTNGGGANSWLTLTWSSPVTLATIILHDRINLNDQITSGTLTFSNGTQIQVGALPNDGSGLTVNVPDITTTTLTLTVNSVSASTQNVGLAEIEAWTPAGSGGGNQPPVASAGPAQTVTAGAAVSLDGSGSSDPGGNPLTYQWTQTAGPAVTLSSATAVKPTFTAPATAGTLTFQLVVNNGTLSSAPSSVSITVTGANQPPVASAGPAQTVTAGAAVSLDGSGSSDPGGNPLTYQWTQTAGPSVTLSSATAVKPTFTAPATAGTLTFQLVVNNGTLSSAPSSVSITVTGANQPPVASAGPAQTVTAGAAVSLDGSGSSDPGGNPLTYQWTQTAGPAVTLSSATAVNPTFTAPNSAGTLTFELVVNDGTLSSAASSVSITVTSDLAMAATATASSQDTAYGQTAAKAIDGVVGGYPTDPSNEWATVGGGVGSWLKLTWSSPVTLATIVLYDRPDGQDQITSATLTFSDGTQIPVGTLPPNDSPVTVDVPNITTTTLTLTVDSVSASTQNVGLAEIEAFAPVTNGQQPIANAGPAQTVTTGAAVSLDGSGSWDPGGNPLTYQWVQTSGPAVTLSSATAVNPTFTAPNSAGTLTFELVVNDGTLSSAASSVSITVTSDLAMAATATASSQDTAYGQTAAKAIDGVVGGYPTDPSNEWATVGGGVGSWLKLTWSSPVTLATIVLYDRPDGQDQITSATLTFSDGTQIPVGTLPPNDSPVTVDVPNITTTTLTLTVDSVSASTQNVGLAEIEAYS